MPVMKLSVRKTWCVISRDVIQIRAKPSVQKYAKCQVRSAEWQRWWGQCSDCQHCQELAGDCASPRSSQRPWPQLELGLESQGMYIQTHIIYTCMHTCIQLAWGWFKLEAVLLQHCVSAELCSTDRYRCHFCYAISSNSFTKLIKAYPYLLKGFPWQS